MLETPQPGNRALGKRVDPVEEGSERHRGVEIDLVPGLSEVQEILELGCPEVSDHDPEAGVAGQYLPERAGPCEAPRDRPGAAVHDRKRPGLGQLPPHVVELRVARVVPAHLQVSLHDHGPGGEGVRDVARRRRLGEEGRRMQDVGMIASERPRPVVQPLGHPRLVRVQQGREHPDAPAPQPRQPGLGGLAVGDRPGPAVVAGRVVEERPHRLHNPVRHEVDVQIHEARQPERPPELNHVLVVRGGGGGGGGGTLPLVVCSLGHGRPTSGNGAGPPGAGAAAEPAERARSAGDDRNRTTIRSRSGASSSAAASKNP